MRSEPRVVRPGARGRSRPKRAGWLVAAGGLLVYAGLVSGAVLAGIRLDMGLPWWVAQPVAPVICGALVWLGVRRLSWERWFGATLVLWAVHLALGALTQAATGQSSIFPPPPLPALLWVPLLLLPLQDVLAGSRERRDRHRGAPDRTRVVAALARQEPSTPTTSGMTEEAAPSPPQGQGAPREGSAPRSEPEAGRAARSAPVGPSPAQRLLDDMLARETAGEAIRISFERITGQLPSAAFHGPLDRVGAALAEPGYLLVPRRLALVQLAEGLVRAGWEVVADQFPRSLLAVTDDEIRRHLPDGQLVLPLDEVVAQMPPELFLAAGPLADVPDIESFPLPFQRLPAAAGEDVAIAEPLPGVAQPDVRVETTEEPALIDDRLDASTPESSLLELVDMEAGLVTADAFEAERWPTDATPPMEMTWEPPRAFADIVAGASQPRLPQDEGAPPAADAPPAPESPVPAVAPRPEVETITPAAVQASPRGPSAEEIASARRVAARLAPLVPLDVDAQVVDEVLLFTVSSPGLDREQCGDVSRLMLPLLGSSRAPWPVEQLTLRGGAPTVVMTPLGALADGGPVLVSALSPGGSLALLEIVCRRAAAGHAKSAGRRNGGANGAGRDEPDVIDVEPPRRLHQVASTLGAVGPVTVSALRDAETEEPFYLFLPAGSDVRSIGGFAAEVARALRKAAETGVVFHSAVLRSGRRRMVIRLPDPGAARSSVIVAAGETDRPGLAYRQVESAALTLAAL
ncbi:MAG TPA: hypothetical protein VGT40_02960 [Methylomirabilota bacterium]|nr:hypothetical protein [Methylomirabilota bacterium]